MKSSGFVGFAVLVVVLIATFSLSVPALGQEQAQAVAAPRPPITATVDEARLTTLKGNTHPLARPEFDLGTAPASLPMQRMLLVLKRSDEQETSLRKLLDDQQDKNSPNYHKWLTPEQFGAQYGPTDADLQTITSWLQSHGFEVGSTKGRTVLEFSGSASQVQDAFHTSIHKYVVNGEQHWANASDPSIPAALAPAVRGVLTLHNFLKKPTLHFDTHPVAAKLAQERGKARPQVTFTQNGQTIHALSPQDYRVIYDMNSVNVPAISTIAVVGRSNLYNGGQDISNFLGLFGGGNFLITLNGPDPGDLGGGEEAEATLDSSWSTALAPNSTVNLVVSASTDTTDGVDLSEIFIVENDLSAIMTESFSACELYATDGQLAFATAMAEQAAAQGITYIVSTGDDGSAGCDDPSHAPASYPASVNYLASTPFNVAVGGTMFNENGQDAAYWSNAAPIAESALSYIPENVWNESSLSGGLWAGSGGASAGNVQSGLGTTGGVPKPSWQFGVFGIPADGVRDLPDLSLTAASHDPYLLCWEGSCVPDNQGFISVYFISGTSASAPAFAGIMAYVNEENTQMTGRPRVGLPNYVLYRLAATQSVYPSHCNGSSAAAPPDPTCVFNDVTVGTNVVPGEPSNDYQAGVGYDLASGLGSVNVGNLVSNWNTVTFNPTTTTFTMSPPASFAHGTPIDFTVSVSPNSGNGIPTGDVSLAADIGMGGPGKSGVTLAGVYPLSHGSVVSSTADLPGGGPYWVWAYYPGDSTYAPSGSTAISVNVTPEASATGVSVLTGDQFGNSSPFTGGPFGSFVYLRADVVGQSGRGFATGSVSFSDTFGPIPGGSTFALNGQSNAATPNGVFNFDTGTHTISASYGGDASFGPSSTTQSQTFTITPGFYATIPSTQQTVLVAAPGGSGTTSLSVTNSSAFSGNITFACSGLPSESKCSFSPSSIAASGAATTTPVSITVTTAAATARNQLQRSSGGFNAWVVGAGLILPALFLVGGKQRHRGLILTFMLMLVTLIPACGGGSGGGNTGPPPNSGTPKGSSSVTVTATSGSIVSQTGFTLIVQ